MAPLRRVAVMDLSGIASMLLYLKSIATGQRMSSARSTTVSSQPPHEAHQYKATLGLGISGLQLVGRGGGLVVLGTTAASRGVLRFHLRGEMFHLRVPLLELPRHAQRTQLLDLADHLVHHPLDLLAFGGRNPFQAHALLFDA